MCAKYHFFCCGLLYQYKFFENDLILTMFAQIFWIRRVVKLGVRKVKRPIIGNGEYIAELVTMGIVNLNHLCSFLLEDYTQHTTPGNPQCYATRKSCSVFSEIEYYLIKISCSWFAHAGPEQRSTSEQQRGFGKVSPLQVHSLVYLFLS